MEQLTEIEKKIVDEWFSQIDPVIMDKHPNSHERRKHLQLIFNTDLFSYVKEKEVTAYMLSTILKKIGYTMSAGSIIDRAVRLGYTELFGYESAGYEHVKNRKKNACLLKYGCENPSQSDIIKKVKTNTLY